MANTGWSGVVAKIGQQALEAEVEGLGARKIVHYGCNDTSYRECSFLGEICDNAEVGEREPKRIRVKR